MPEYTTWINLESKDFSTSAQHSHLKKKENPSDYSTDTHGDISTDSIHTYTNLKKTKRLINKKTCLTERPGELTRISVMETVGSRQVIDWKRGT